MYRDTRTANPQIPRRSLGLWRATAVGACLATLVLAAGCGSSKTSTSASNSSSSTSTGSSSTESGSSSTASTAGTSLTSTSSSSSGQTKGATVKSGVAFTKAGRRTGPLCRLAAAQSGTVAIAYRNFAIDPDAVKVKVGSTLKWTNYDPVANNVTSIGSGAAKLAWATSVKVTASK